MPSVLFVNRVYPPDNGATGIILEHVARGFKDAGWDVSVLATAGANSEAGVAIQDGIKVVRVALPFSRRSLFVRALGYLLMIPALGLKALLMQRADLVVTMTDPPMLLLTGPFLKLMRGSLLIHWAQDLYPEVGEADGVFRKGSATASFLRWISSAAMRCHQRVVVVGRCMAARIAERGLPVERIEVIPNTGIAEKIIPATDRGWCFRKRHGLGDAFVVMYSGNMGRAHEFGTVLKAAHGLQEKGVHDVKFLLVGKGPGEAMLRDEAHIMGLRNVRFLLPQPTDSLSESLGAADVHLVTIKESMSGLVVPSKFYGVLAAARPCLFVGPGDSEVARVIMTEGIGRVISPGRSDELQSAILEYRNQRALICKEGERGRSILTASDTADLFVKYAAALIE